MIARDLLTCALGVVNRQPDGADLVRKAINLITFLGRFPQLTGKPLRDIGARNGLK